MQRSLVAHPVHFAIALLALAYMAAHAQSPAAAPMSRSDAAGLGDTLLAKAAALYASTAKSGLRGFDCSVHPDWRKIKASSRTSSASTGSDSEIDLLNAVKITLHARFDGDSTLGWVVPAGKPLDADTSARLDRAHRGIEQTLEGALKLWIPLVNGSVAESLGAEDVDISQNSDGYSVRSRDKRHSLAEEFDRKLVLTRYVIADSGSVVDVAPAFQSTSQGLLLSSFAARVRAAGLSEEKTQEIHFSVEYQTVSGAQIPGRLVIDVSNVVTMEFVLDGCVANLK